MQPTGIVVTTMQQHAALAAPVALGEPSQDAGARVDITPARIGTRQLPPFGCPDSVSLNSALSAITSCFTVSIETDRDGTYMHWESG